MSEEAPSPQVPVRIWDLPTRLAHWLFAGGVAVSWWTGETGRLEWHRWSGYTLLGLVIFRTYWGFFGGSTARFSQFLRGPRAITRYLQGGWELAPGHNPLGALSVIALLLLLVLQVGLGLFAVDVDGIESGPLSLYVSFESGRVAAEWHDSTFKVLLALIGLHIAAILYYRVVRRERLVAAMFHGTREYPREIPPLQGGSRVSFIIGVLLAFGLTWAVTRAFQF